MYDACVPWPERPKGAKDKSRGPKGLELEVGARRAPKLLVLLYFLNTRVYAAYGRWILAPLALRPWDSLEPKVADLQTDSRQASSSHHQIVIWICIKKRKRKYWDGNAAYLSAFNSLDFVQNGWMWLESDITKLTEQRDQEDSNENVNGPSVNAVLVNAGAK